MTSGLDVQGWGSLRVELLSEERIRYRQTFVAEAGDGVLSCLLSGTVSSERFGTLHVGVRTAALTGGVSFLSRIDAASPSREIVHTWIRSTQPPRHPTHALLITALRRRPFC